MLLWEVLFLHVLLHHEDGIPLVKGWGWKLRLWLGVLHCWMLSFLLLLVAVLVAAAARESGAVFGSFELLFRWG